MLYIPLLLLAIYFWWSVAVEVVGLLFLAIRGVWRWFRDKY